MYFLAMVLAVGVGLWSPESTAGSDPSSITETELRAFVATRTPEERARLLADAQAREGAMREIMLSRTLEIEAANAGELDSVATRRALHGAREQILIDALRRHRAIEDRPSDADLEALALDYYTAYPDQYRIQDQIKIAHISRFTDPAHPEQTEQSMREIAKRLADGEIFVDLAAELSEAPNAARGGIVDRWLIAPIDLERHPPFIQQAFALKQIGEISEPFESGRGWHIIALLERKPGALASFEEVKTNIMDDLRGDYLKRRFNDYLTRLEPPEDATIETSRLTEVIEQFASESTP